MYKAGDMSVALRELDDEDPNYYLEPQPPMDARADYQKTIPCAFLVHSCQEWVIGGPDQIRAMIADLEAALKEMEQ